MSNKDKHDKIRDFFIDCFYSILGTVDRVAESFSEGEVTLKELRLIEIVLRTKIEGNNNFSNVAKALDITLGTLTAAFSRLERKQYLYKVRDSKDKRVYYIEPTSNAIKMYERYQAFHNRMFLGIFNSMTETQLEHLAKGLGCMTEYFMSLREEMGYPKTNPRLW